MVCFIFLRRRYSVSWIQRKKCWWALGEWISNDQTRTSVREPVSIYSFSILDSSRAWDLLFRDYFVLDFWPALCLSLTRFNSKAVTMWRLPAQSLCSTGIQLDIKHFVSSSRCTNKQKDKRDFHKKGLLLIPLFSLLTLYFCYNYRYHVVVS